MGKSMDIRLIFLNFGTYAWPDASSSLQVAMDMLLVGEKVTRKGPVISVSNPYRKLTQVGESSRLR
jgi:alpha-D-ribose 1-methylphosphonate 5-triphosphate synthase subunit PhnH